jgi:hypothetical protein
MNQQNEDVANILLEARLVADAITRENQDAVKAYVR